MYDIKIKILVKVRILGNLDDVFAIFTEIGIKLIITIGLLPFPIVFLRNDVDIAIRFLIKIMSGKKYKKD